MGIDQNTKVMLLISFLSLSLESNKIIFPYSPIFIRRLQFSCTPRRNANIKLVKCKLRCLMIMKLSTKLLRCLPNQNYLSAMLLPREKHIHHPKNNPNLNIYPQHLNVRCVCIETLNTLQIVSSYLQWSTNLKFPFFTEQFFHDNRRHNRQPIS